MGKVKNQLIEEGQFDEFDIDNPIRKFFKFTSKPLDNAEKQLKKVLGNDN